MIHILLRVVLILFIIILEIKERSIKVGDDDLWILQLSARYLSIILHWY